MKFNIVSNTFDYQHKGTTTMSTFEAVLYCHGKIVLIFLHLWGFGLFNYGYKSFKSSNAF